MDAVFAQIQADLRSNDGLRQAGALLQALQHSAAGRDISVISKCACDEIIASPASAVCKKLAFDLIRCTRLTNDQWETVCRGIKNDFDFPDPDVTAAGVSFLSAIPSHRLGRLITDCSKEISTCLVSESDNLRYAITEILGCILAWDNLVFHRAPCRSKGIEAPQIAVLSHPSTDAWPLFADAWFLKRQMI